MKTEGQAAVTSGTAKRGDDEVNWVVVAASAARQGQEWVRGQEPSHGLLLRARSGVKHGCEGKSKSRVDDQANC